MRWILPFALTLSLASGQSTLVHVEGGTITNPSNSAFYYQTVSSFKIATKEVTWQEWLSVRSWAIANGYDLSGAGEGVANNHPVSMVSWHDVVKWCNAKSEMTGLEPVYKTSGEPYRRGEQHPLPDPSANGFRLPTEFEWEWAARGGLPVPQFSYSGSSNLNEVAWFTSNSVGALVGLDAGGRGTWPVAQKLPSQIGTYDMTGNVSEWCFALAASSQKPYRGGGYWESRDNNYLLTTRLSAWATTRQYNIGFRLAKNDGPSEPQEPSQFTDTDGDGLNDLAEYRLRDLGFDWQTAQSALVNALFTNANVAGLYTSSNVVTNPSAFGLFTQLQYSEQFESGRASGRADVTDAPASFSLFTQAQYDGNRAAGRLDVVSNPASYNLYDDESIMDLRFGGKMVRKEGGNAVFELQLQVTTNLATDPFANYGVPITNTIPMPGRAGFLRIRSVDQP